MNTIAVALVGFVAVIHIYIAVFEMFLWERRGPKVFSSFDPGMFAKTGQLAFNQGLYNGFLAAGLIWSLAISEDVWQQRVATCFLLMVFVAGIVGALTAERRILFVQSVPAAAALIAVWI